MAAAVASSSDSSAYGGILKEFNGVMYSGKSGTLYVMPDRIFWLSDSSRGRGGEDGGVSEISFNVSDWLLSRKAKAAAKVKVELQSLKSFVLEFTGRDEMEEFCNQLSTCRQLLEPPSSSSSSSSFAATTASASSSASDVYVADVKRRRVVDDDGSHDAEATKKGSDAAAYSPPISPTSVNSMADSAKAPWRLHAEASEDVREEALATNSAVSGRSRTLSSGKVCSGLTNIGGGRGGHGGGGGAHHLVNQNANLSLSHHSSHLNTSAVSPSKLPHRLHPSHISRSHPPPPLAALDRIASSSSSSSSAVETAESLLPYRSDALAEDAELRDYFDTLVVQGEFLTADEFWERHVEELLRAKHLGEPPSEDSAGFLIQPPVTENFSGTSASGGGGGNVMTEVKVTRNHLDRILEEDAHVRALLQASVPFRMTEKVFWERFFQSRYFHQMVGRSMPSSLSSSSSSDDTEFGELKVLPCLSAVDVQRKTEITLDLMSNEALRKTGFGIADGLSSFSGDLVESTSVINRNTTEGGGRRPPSLIKGSQSSFRFLINRFNRHASKVLENLQTSFHDPSSSCSNDEGRSGMVAAAVGGRGRGGGGLRQREGGRMTNGGGGSSKQRMGGGEGADGEEEGEEEEREISAKQKALEMEVDLSDLREEKVEEFTPLPFTRKELYAAAAATTTTTTASNTIETSASSTSSGGSSISSSMGSSSSSTSDSSSSKQRETENVLSSSSSSSSSVTVSVLPSLKDIASSKERQLLDECLLQIKVAMRTKQQSSSSSSSSVSAAPSLSCGRTMFVFNTKLCQTERVMQMGVLDYEMEAVANVSNFQNRVKELLQHFYCSPLGQEERREKILRALDITKEEMEVALQRECSGTAKSLYTPVFDIIKAARSHAEKMRRFIKSEKDKQAKARAAFATRRRAASPSPAIGSSSSSGIIISGNDEGSSKIM